MHYNQYFSKFPTVSETVRTQDHPKWIITPTQSLPSQSGGNMGVDKIMETHKAH